MNQSHFEEEPPHTVSNVLETETLRATASPQTLSRLKREMGSLSKKRREAALQELLGLGQEGTDALLDIETERG